MAGKMKPGLNVVDQLVKHYLLKSPGMYPSRLSVLRYLFFTCGHGFFWQKDGTLGSRNPGDVCTKMNFSDLDSPPRPASPLDAKIAQFLAADDEIEEARNKRERAMRMLVAEDIDLYAANNVMEDSLNILSFRHFDLDGGLIASAPFEVLDHQWARAMIELLDEANHELREALQVRDPGFSRATADPLILGYYDKIQALTGKVASVPGLYNKTTLESVIDMLEKGGAW